MISVVCDGEEGVVFYLASSHVMWLEHSHRLTVAGQAIP